MVRYAPNSRKAQDYVTHFFQNIETPLRTPAQEVVVLINLIFVYWEEGEVDEALTLIKLVIEMSVYEINPQHFVEKYRGTHKNHLEVFENVSQKVIVHFNLQFAPDKSKLIPLRRE